MEVTPRVYEPAHLQAIKEARVPIPFDMADMEAVRERCCELGMPDDVWDNCNQTTCASLIDPHYLNMGHVGVLTIVRGTVMHHHELERGFFKQFHPYVEAGFLRIFPLLQVSFFYLTTDPDFAALRCDEPEPYARALNHQMGLRDKDIRDYTPPRIGRPPSSNKPVPQARAALTAEQEQQRVLEAQEKLIRSARYAEWLLECEAYRASISAKQLEIKQLDIVVTTRISELQEEIKQAKEPLELARQELYSLKLGGAPKLNN